jgi:hypothetical protein
VSDGLGKQEPPEAVSRPRIPAFPHSPTPDSSGTHRAMYMGTREEMDEGRGP